MTMKPVSRNVVVCGCRLAALLVGALALSGCVAEPPPPQVVEKSQPAVTYEYTSDSDLIVVTQRAEAYCREFSAWPETRRITPNPDGSKTVAFECNKAEPGPLPEPVVMTPTQPSISYTVRTDQELVDALRSAEGYCGSKSLRTDTQTINRNADGSRTVHFRCVSA